MFDVIHLDVARVTKASALEDATCALIERGSRSSARSMSA